MVVLEEARGSARDFTAGNLDEQWQILASVPTVLWELYFGSEAGADIAARYRERSGYELALTEGKQSKATSDIMRERVVSYKGASVSILAHIKGRSKDPKRAFRVHYYVDREDRKIADRTLRGAHDHGGDPEAEVSIMNKTLLIGNGLNRAEKCGPSWDSLIEEIRSAKLEACYGGRRRADSPADSIRDDWLV